jgi:hypothetical protein
MPSISFLNTPGTQKIGTLLLCVCSSLYYMALGFMTTDTMDTRRNGPRTTRKNFLPRFYILKNKAAKPLIFFASAKTRWTTGREPTGTAE